MRIGIPIWGERVSPVMDTAERLLLLDAAGEPDASRREIVLGQAPAAPRAQAIADLGVEVLICGAISRSLAEMLALSGVRVVPWISGELDEVLEAFGCGDLVCPRFLMPGCRGRHGGGEGRRRRSGAGGGRGGGQGRQRRGPRR